MKGFSLFLFLIAIVFILPASGIAAGAIQVEGVIKNYIPSEKLVITDNSGKEEAFSLSAKTHLPARLMKGMSVTVAANGHIADSVRRVYSTDSIPEDLYPPRLGSVTD